ncbi:MAG TPA: TIM44-like domain-containing protein [Burkholderiales bacterium]
MRKALSLFGFLVALIGSSLIAADADAARRLGGGRNIGSQREAINPQHAAPRAPAQQQGAQNTPAKQPQTAPVSPPAPQPSGMSRWLGPLAGLAIGAGLASLFLHNGLGGALGGMLLIAALVIGAIFLVRLFRGGRTAQQPLRYAGADPYARTEPTSVPARMPAAPAMGGTPAPHSVAAATSGVAAAPRWPADFNAEEFVRHAKLNFVKLQEAHDRKDLASLRDFLTPEMYKAIEDDIRASGSAPQKTEVVTLDAQVLDVATENASYVVSVRFSGLIRDEPGAQPEPFSEVWHLTKPLDGRSGWQLAGIQQV